LERVNQSHYFDNYYKSVNSQTLFFRPKLCIEFDENDTNTFSPAFNNNTKYLKVRIRNYGRSTAHNCKGKVRVIPNGVDSMNYPSTEVKKLVWGSTPDLTDLRESTDIQKRDEEMLHVVFAFRSFPLVYTINTPTRYASFSIKERLEKIELRVNDSFTSGDFDIEISVFSDETNTKRCFRIHIGTSYINVGMNMLPLSKKNNIKYQLSKFF